MTFAERFFFSGQFDCLETNPFLFIRSGHWKWVPESNQLMPRMMEENSFWGPYIGVLPSVEEPAISMWDGFFGIRSAENIWMFPKIVGFPPKSSILIEFSIINPSILGVLPLFLETPICILHWTRDWLCLKRRILRMNFHQHTHRPLK